MAVVREITTAAGTALPVYESWAVRRCRYMPEGGGQGRICLVSGVHGDETLGQLVIFNVVQRIMAQPEHLRGVVDMYPMLNPLGLDIGERMVPVGTRLDMNRSFPGSRDGTPLERTCRSLIDDMAGADLVIDIHSGTQLKHELFEVRLYTQDPEPLIALSAHLQPDLIWLYQDSVADEASLSGALCAIGTPALLLQADEHGQAAKQAAERAAEGILRLMKHMGLWTGDVSEAAQADVPCIRTEAEVARVTCSKPGMYVPEGCIGTRVAKGQLLGRIIDAVEGVVCEQIVSPCAGLVFSQRCYSPVYPGTLIARIHAQGE